MSKTKTTRYDVADDNIASCGIALCQRMPAHAMDGWWRAGGECLPW